LRAELALGAGDVLHDKFQLAPGDSLRGARQAVGELAGGHVVPTAGRVGNDDRHLIARLELRARRVSAVVLPATGQNCRHQGDRECASKNTCRIGLTKGTHGKQTSVGKSKVNRQQLSPRRGA
jgi:hypothetical protein